MQCNNGLWITSQLSYQFGLATRLGGMADTNHWIAMYLHTKLRRLKVNGLAIVHVCVQKSVWLCRCIVYMHM